MIKVFLLIIGGAIGSALRFGVSTWVQRSMLYSFPFGILSVNVIGSFLIGFCWSIAEAYNFSINTRAFLFTGLFGGFTTFSS
ncbi:MAG: CrcB family protein, partial [Parabacteroides sp.]|nr:CrcB family protein [Parabacteroides sp.]